MFKNIILALLLYSYNVTAESNNIKPYLVPGGIAIIPIESKTKPSVKFNDKNILIKQDKNNYYAIIGIPLDLKNKKNKILILENNKSYEKYFEIKNKNYPEEHLKFQNNSKVTPNQTNQPRIKKERTRVLNAYATFSDQKIDNIKLSSPVKIFRKSSPFGAKRVLNNIVRSTHTGLDFAAPIGTTVTAAKAGKVILADNLFYLGNAVFIDHGQGFITSYGHLNNIFVKAGDLLKTGDKIGEIGMTGRVTGPHLHFSVCLNKTLIDPELLL